jgi:hypothetical protein
LHIITEWAARDINIYSTPTRTLSQLEKYNFSGKRKDHWPGQCNCIKRTTTLLSSSGHFRKQMCDAIPLGRYGLIDVDWFADRVTPMHLGLKLKALCAPLLAPSVNSRGAPCHTGVRDLC